MKSVSKNALPREAGFLLYFYREREQMQGGSAQRRGSISKHMLTLFYYYSGLRLHQDSQPGEKYRQDRWIFFLISSSLVLFALVFAVLVGGWACTYKNQASQPHTPTHPITAKQALTLTATWHYALYYKSLLSLKEHCLHVKCIWLSIQGVL